MKKKKWILVISHIIFVISVMAFLLSIFELNTVGNAFDVLLNRKYEATDQFYHTLLDNVNKLNAVVNFEEEYYENGERNGKALVVGKHTVDELMELVDYGELEMINDNISYEVTTPRSNKMYQIEGIDFRETEIGPVCSFLQDYADYLNTKNTLEENTSNLRYHIKWIDNNGAPHEYSNTNELKSSYQNYISWGKDAAKHGNPVPEFHIPQRDDSYAMSELTTTLFRNIYRIKECDAWVAVDSAYGRPDEFASDYQQFMMGKKYFGKCFYLSALILVITLSYMVIHTGKTEKGKRIRLNTFDRCFSEVGFVVTLVGIAICASIAYTGLEQLVKYTGFQNDLSYYSEYYRGNTMNFIEICLGMMALAAMIEIALSGFLSLVRRIRAGTLIYNSICGTIYRNILKGFRTKDGKLPVIRRVVILFVAYLLVNLANYYIFVRNELYDNSNRNFLVSEMLIQIATLAVIFHFFSAYSQIQKHVEKMAGGEIEHKIRIKHFDGMNRNLADNINKIGNGMNQAVSESIKNERLKTDLITNVSHDIKTPLTSIINYVGLLKREKIENERVQSYIRILDEKSVRLKNLTDDLVEASKLSSGVMKLNLTKLNLKELVGQVNGEFEEKYATKDLKIISVLCEEAVMINGDGQKVWRILENLYNNAYKYSLEGTRVYVNLSVEGIRAVVEIKNISESPMNFEVNELTERFIRGDIARSTEGSGLGLSIVRSLVELHGGKLEIKLDGDLFKVRIEFNRIQ